MVENERKTQKNEIILEVWSKYACFTRPEFKVERVTYDVMTPSAARGILEAIYFKPQFRYVVEEIQVMNPIKTMSIRRNEVTDKIQVSQIKKAMTARTPIYQNADEITQRRSAIILKDVRYFIKAHIEMVSETNPENNLTKHYVMFRQRANRGKCFRQPYLGCREFSAYFDIHDEITESPIDESRDLQYMLYDLEYNDATTKIIEPIFFRAYMDKGVIKIPDELKTINHHGWNRRG